MDSSAANLIFVKSTSHPDVISNIEISNIRVEY